MRFGSRALRATLLGAVLVMVSRGLAAPPPEPLTVDVDATRAIGSLEPFWASQIIHPTENPTADVRNSEFGSAFLVDWVSRHIDMKQQNNRHFEGFTFCASGYERAPAHDFMGYRTLHTKNGFHKPILNAYKLLDRLSGKLVPAAITPADSGVRAFAATSDERVSVVLVHFRHNDIKSEGESRTARLKIALPWSSETPVEIAQWCVDKNHSNAYTAYKEIGSPEKPTAEQISAVKKRMELELLKPAERTTCRDIAGVDVELSSNGVVLVEFAKMP